MNIKSIVSGSSRVLFLSSCLASAFISVVDAVAADPNTVMVSSPEVASAAISVEPTVALTAETKQTIKSLLEAGDYDQPEQMYKSLISQDSRSDTALEAMQGLAEMYVRSARLDEAEQTYHQLVTAFPLDGDKKEQVAVAVYKIAQSYRATVKYNKAIELYRTVIDNSSNTDLVLKNWGYIVLSHYLAGDNESGQIEMDKLIAEFDKYDDSELDKAIHYIAKRFQWANRLDVGIKIHEYNADRFGDRGLASGKFACWSMVNTLGYYGRQGDTAKINTLVSKWLPKCPDAASKSFLVCAAASKQQKINLDGAVALHEQNAASYPGQNGAMRSNTFLAKHYITNGQYDLADSYITALRDMYKDKDSLPTELFAVVRKYMVAKQYGKVQSLCKDLGKDFVGHKDFYVLGACNSVAKLMLGDNKGANSELQKLSSKIPADSYTGNVSYRIYQIARDYNWAGNADDALKIHKYNVELFPDHKPVFSRLEIALIQIRQGDWAGVDASADELINKCAGHERLGEAVLVIGEKCIEAANDLGQKGQAEQSRLHYQQAIKIFDKLINGIPRSGAHPYVWYYKATAHEKTGDDLKAAQCFQKVVDEWPDYDKAWHAQYMVGKGYEKMADKGMVSRSIAKAKARKAFNLLKKNYPNSPVAKAVEAKLRKNSR